MKTENTEQRDAAIAEFVRIYIYVPENLTATDTAGLRKLYDAGYAHGYAAGTEAETQRLREANAVLMEAVERYADRSRWMQSPDPNEFYGDDMYVGSPNGYDIAQVAIDKAKEILGGD